jgi:translation initiation factor 3 subunit C
VTREQDREPVKTSKSQSNKVAEVGEDESDNFTTVGKGGKSLTFSAETILKNLIQIQEARGKKVFS